MNQQEEISHSLRREKEERSAAHTAKLEGQTLTSQRHTLIADWHRVHAIGLMRLEEEEKGRRSKTAEMREHPTNNG